MKKTGFDDSGPQPECKVTPDLPTQCAVGSATDLLKIQRVIGELEAARIIGVSPAQLRRMRRQGVGLSYVQLSERRLGYRIAALIAFLDARTVTASEQKYTAGGGQHYRPGSETGCYDSTNTPRDES